MGFRVAPNDTDLWNKVSWARYLSEFVGTFWLVLTIAFVTSPSVNADNVHGAFAVASVLTTMIYMGGPVAKAQYNPVVTMMFVIHGTFTVWQGVIYVITQLLAGFFAALLGFGLTESSSVPGPKGVIKDSPWRAVVIEMLYTFVLVEIICIVALARPHANNGYYAPAIALAVLGGALSVGSMTGAVFNPCVGFGLILASAALYGTSVADLWIYFLGPILGSLLAYAAFRGQYVEELNVESKPVAKVYSAGATREETGTVDIAAIKPANPTVLTCKGKDTEPPLPEHGVAMEPEAALVEMNEIR